MNIKKFWKKWILLIAIIIVVLISGCVLHPSLKSPLEFENIEAYVDYCTEKSIGISANIMEIYEHCVSRYLAETKNYNACFDSKNPLRGICFTEVATLKGDISFCEEVEDDVMSRIDTDSCIYSVAYSLKKKELCQKISSEEKRDSCYRIILRDSQSTRLEDCELINDLEERGSCQSRVAILVKDISICEVITPAEPYNHREACFYYVAREKNEPTLCDSVKDVTDRDDCYKNIGPWSGNEAFCFKIISEEKKSMCFRKVAQGLNDPNICDKIENQLSKEQCILHDLKAVTSVEDCEKMKYYKPDCYYALSEKFNDPIFCDKTAEDAYWRNKCLTKFVTSIEDCEKMTAVKPECYYQLAKKLNDASLCDKIEENEIEKEFLKSKCMFEFVESRKDCNEIKNIQFRGDCLFKYATSKEDCDEIEDIYSRGECLFKYATSKEDCDEIENTFFRENCLSKYAT